MLRAANNNLNEIDLNASNKWTWQAPAPEDGACASATTMPCPPLCPSKSRHTSASAQVQSGLPKVLAQAQPPAAVGQPFPALWQHHSFLGIDHPAIQFAKPALQSYGAEVVPTGAHPPDC